MRKISPGIHYDPVRFHLPPEVHGHLRILPPVDPPGLIGPFPVGTVLADAVNSVSCRKHRLSPGLHIGIGMGIAVGVPVLVAHVQRQIPI